MRFGVLGPVTVWTQAGEQVRVPEVKVRTLLAVLLARRGRPVAVERLVDEIWGDEPPVRPVPALHRKVWQLRRALEEAERGARSLVESRPPGYLLRVSDDAVDADRFQRLTGQARGTADPRTRADLLTEALALWRGPAYADFADEEFTRAEAARLEEERLLALEDRAEAWLESGEYRAVVGELSGLVRRWPARERMRAAHMRALYHLGRQSEALNGFHELRAHLREELGVDPEPGIVALYQSMLEQRPPPGAPSPATNVPEPFTALVGRDGQVDEVRRLVESSRLVTLTGPGGVGKTRLAVETARHLLGSCRDGVWLVELAGAAVPGGAVERVAAVLGVRDDAGFSPVARSASQGDELDRLVAALRARRMLLVLDNCEHIVGQVADLVGTLLRAAPEVRVLATSREPLGHPGEVVWTVPPLALPDPEHDADPAVVARSGAVRLFVARAAAAAPGFALDSGNAEDVARLCRRLDGVPLALELAATRVRALGVRGVLSRLDDRFRLLASGLRGAPSRQQTLRAVMDWSWDLLGPDERVLFRRVAVFGECFTLEATEAVCSEPPLRAGEVAALLARLVDRSLVVAVPDDHGGVRYRLLESVAEYGVERLREAGELACLRRRHAHWYTELAEAAARRLRGPDQSEWAYRLDAEAANLRVALDGTVREGLAEDALRLVDALGWYWFLRGRWAEALRSMECALALPEVAPARLTARVVAWRAGFAVLRGAAADPARQCRAALEGFDEADDPSGRSWSQWFLAYALFGSGDQKESEDLVDRALSGFRAAGDAWGVAAALATRAHQAVARGDLESLARNGGESLARFEDLRDSWGRLYALDALTVSAEISGDYRRARRLNEESLRLAEQLGLPAAIAGAISRMGRTALLTGDHRAADELHERARRLALEQGDRSAELFACLGLALSARRQGRLDEAERLLRPWTSWCVEVDWQPGLALLLAELGFAAELRGEAETALRLHLDGLAAARRTGDPRAGALALEGLAGAHALAGRHREAARLLGAADAARDRAGAPLPPPERGDVDRIAAAARAALGDDTYACEFSRGRAEGLETEAR
ncbi:MAG TPA: BTAD domain-containing putative transcriptional regulator [Thermomonospora sp.]|nr:BTAD domain-containing putative transcriptional regulator [Thermomonospora sp.]